MVDSAVGCDLQPVASEDRIGLRENGSQCRRLVQKIELEDVSLDAGVAMPRDVEVLSVVAPLSVIDRLGKGAVHARVENTLVVSQRACGRIEVEYFNIAVCLLRGYCNLAGAFMPRKVCGHIDETEGDVRGGNGNRA